MPAYGKKTAARALLRPIALFCAIIVSLTVFVFSPSLKNGFTNWDDNTYVSKSPDVKRLSLHNLWNIFSSSYQGNYQPLVLLIYMVEKRIFWLNPTAFHATNLILHCINALLVLSQ